MAVRTPILKGRYTNNRRDLNSSQRAAIAVEAEDLIETLKSEAKAAQAKFHGNQYTEKSGLVELIPQVQKTDPEQNQARAQLAQTFNTNPRYVSDAARLKRENPQAFEAIKSGQKAITQVKQEEKVKDFKIAFNCKYSKQLYLILKKYP